MADGKWPIGRAGRKGLAGKGEAAGTNVPPHGKKDRAGGGPAAKRPGLRGEHGVCAQSRAPGYRSASKDCAGACRGKCAGGGGHHASATDAPPTRRRGSRGARPPDRRPRGPAWCLRRRSALQAVTARRSGGGWSRAWKAIYDPLSTAPRTEDFWKRHCTHARSPSGSGSRPWIPTKSRPTAVSSAVASVAGRPSWAGARNVRDQSRRRTPRRRGSLPRRRSSLAPSTGAR